MDIGSIIMLLIMIVGVFYFAAHQENRNKAKRIEYITQQKTQIEPVNKNEFTSRLIITAVAAIVVTGIFGLLAMVLKY